MNPWLRGWWLTVPVLLAGIIVAVGLMATEPRGATDEHHESSSGDSHAESSHADEDPHDKGHGDGHEDEHGARVTRIRAESARRAGIRVETAGPATLTRTVALTGTVQADPNRLAEVRPRYTGLVHTVAARIGDRVAAGDTLAVVESNDSLQRFEVRAPIGGLVVSRDVQVGQVVGDAPLFRIVDTTEVWIQLDVFGRDLARVEEGQVVNIETIDGYRLEGEIDWLSPLVAHGSQSIRARVIAANPEERLRPGQFVTADVVVDRFDVPLAIDRRAIQTMEDRPVVFVREGESFEARNLEPGREDPGRVEVVSGLEAGEEYVVEGSYVIKADLEKASAAHVH
ncbi:efflux RND transporter periplasmic adaptor subunit [Elongatibacter sediminis]|uniref:Efflux RND transporter periplasmic adaptor subunit n=1 Tax=Elongatibacter sediminis TaxID=3119006 RepID=A0AAW9RHR7_9GAMM